jgi:hypothetical protein
LATRTRKSVKTEMLKVSPQEKTLIKEAKKTAEFKYSYRKIRQEAKRVSDMIKSSSHCVAFTGNCICCHLINRKLKKKLISLKSRICIL